MVVEPGIALSILVVASVVVVVAVVVVVVLLVVVVLVEVAGGRAGLGVVLVVDRGDGGLRWLWLHWWWW